MHHSSSIAHPLSLKNESCSYSSIAMQEARKLLLRGFVFDLLQDRVVDARTARRVVDKLDEMYALGDGGPADSVQKFVSM